MGNYMAGVESVSLSLLLGVRVLSSNSAVIVSHPLSSPPPCAVRPPCIHTVWWQFMFQPCCLAVPAVGVPWCLLLRLLTALRPSAQASLSPRCLRRR